MTFNTTDYSNGVYLSDSSRLNVRNAGIYNLQFSAQLENQDTEQHTVDIWFRKNGTNIANSNSQFTVPARKSASIFGHTIAALNFFVELAANDYVEIVWRAENILVLIEQAAAQTSPTRPATPSIIATMQAISGGSLSNVYVSAQVNGSATISHYSNNTANKTYGYILVG
jgi:hypothetical protein